MMLSISDSSPHVHILCSTVICGVYRVYHDLIYSTGIVLLAGKYTFLAESGHQASRLRTA